MMSLGIAGKLVPQSSYGTAKWRMDESRCSAVTPIGHYADNTMLMIALVAQQADENGAKFKDFGLSWLHQRSLPVIELRF